MPDRYRILLLEDEYLIALDMEQMLRDAGFPNVLVCNDLDQARSSLDSSRIDAAVLDFRLGAVTSEQIAERLVEQGTPFVVASGAHHDEGGTALKKGRWISKPCQTDELGDALRAALRLPPTEARPN